MNYDLRERVAAPNTTVTGCLQPECDNTANRNAEISRLCFRSGKNMQIEPQRIVERYMFVSAMADAAVRNKRRC